MFSDSTSSSTHHHGAQLTRAQQLADTRHGELAAPSSQGQTVVCRSNFHSKCLGWSSVVRGGEDTEECLVAEVVVPLAVTSRFLQVSQLFLRPKQALQLGSHLLSRPHSVSVRRPSIGSYYTLHARDTQCWKITIHITDFSPT